MITKGCNTRRGMECDGQLEAIAAESWVDVSTTGAS